MTTEYTFPELPPRHEWEKHSQGDRFRIYAIDTTWEQAKGNREIIYAVSVLRDGGWLVRAWGNQTWEKYGVFSEPQDAIDVTAALCWMGTATYTFKKDLQHDAGTVETGTTD